MTAKLRVPLTLTAAGSLATVEQDSPDEVDQSVYTLLSTPLGSRIEVPRYGIPDLAFVGNDDVSPVVQALNEWEPRADAVATSRRHEDMTRTVRLT